MTASAHFWREPSEDEADIEVHLSVSFMLQSHPSESGVRAAVGVLWNGWQEVKGD